MSVCLSVSPSLRLALCPVARVTFWKSKRAARNFVQRMRPQDMVSEHLYIQNIQILYVYYYVSADKFILLRAYVSGTKPTGGKIPWVAVYISVCPSICPVVRGYFTIFLFILIFSVGVQHHDAFIPTLGSGGPQWRPVEHFCPYICLSLCLSICLSFYLSGWSFASIFFNQCVWPVIVRSACGRRPWVQIPWVAV